VIPRALSAQTSWEYATIAILLPETYCSSTLVALLTVDTSYGELILLWYHATIQYAILIPNLYTELVYRTCIPNLYTSEKLTASLLHFLAFLFITVHKRLCADVSVSMPASGASADYSVEACRDATVCCWCADGVIS